MQITINSHVFNASIRDYFAIYSNENFCIARKLKKFLEDFSNKPTIIFSSEDIKLIYRSKQIPRFDFVVQYYGHLGGWKGYVTTTSSLDSLTPGQRKFLTEMFESQIVASAPGILEDLIKQTKDNAKTYAKEFVQRQINELQEQMGFIKALENL